METISLFAIADIASRPIDFQVSGGSAIFSLADEVVASSPPHSMLVWNAELEEWVSQATYVWDAEVSQWVQVVGGTFTRVAPVMTQAAYDLITPESDVLYPIKD
jgi:hypothetical protein